MQGWLAERIEENAEYFEYEEEEAEDVGSIPCFTPALDISTGEPLEEVCFGLIPVESPWLVPAFLKFGGWNDCPEASVHLAFFRRWFEQYGAEVVTVTNDVIEFRVSRPPRTPEEAKQLAIEPQATPISLTWNKKAGRDSHPARLRSVARVSASPKPS
ncbi:MAG TPA: DUF4253 domain-containing protein [Steroidobacter sp.]|uniref:DUF4253 domain-containing protein n=1 Tax=Steroidobacter sp. TaxID=1978227 RepID=UPI002ED95493